MSTADRILDLLDAGLQGSDEHGYGTDHTPGQCARCQRHEPAKGGELCDGCRAFLLEDTDDDPRSATGLGRYVDERLLDELERRIVHGDGADIELTGIIAESPRSLSEQDVIEILEAYGVAVAQCQRLWEDLRRTFGEVFRPMVEMIAQILREPLVAELLAEVEASTQPAPPPRHTLNRWASAPARDLRATQAPRRPPMTPRRTP